MIGRSRCDVVVEVKEEEVHGECKWSKLGVVNRVKKMEWERCGSLSLKYV